jgi:ribosomal protein S12 methylthiotransferase
MAALLAQGGFRIASRPEEAEVILINTCTFVLPAREESIDEIFRLAQMKHEGKCRYLIVTGCLPQRYGAILEKEIPEVDLFLGINDIPHIVDFIHRLEEGISDIRRSYIEKPSFLMNSSHPRLLSPPLYSTYLKIAEGCSNYCSYCVIPLVRGAFRSRKMDDSIEEASTLAAQGVKEIILTAQETTAYGKDLEGKQNLALLLRKLSAIDTIRWIRILYTHPASITDEVLSAIAEEKKVCKYIDIPIQHIDDDILKSMNRRVTSETIRHVIRRSRSIIPDVALRTSLIVGYPGETEGKFERLREFVHEARFDHLGVFMYSPEEGTRAAELPDQISEDEKEARRDIIMEEQSIISYDINQSLIGTVQEVMMEGASDLPEYTQVGRLARQAPDIDGVTYIKAKKTLPGEIILCKIVAADEYDLYAEEER